MGPGLFASYLVAGRRQALELRELGLGAERNQRSDPMTRIRELENRLRIGETGCQLGLDRLGVQARRPHVVPTSTVDKDGAVNSYDRDQRRRVSRGSLARNRAP